MRIFSMGYRSDFLPLGNGKWFDSVSGEIIEGIPVYVAGRVKFAEGWFMGFQQAFEVLAKDKDITGAAYRVLNYMLSRLGFENYIAITQAEISEVLEMQKSHVSGAVNLLCKKGVIQKGPKLGRSYAYKLNSNYGWRGKVKNLTKERNRNLKLVK